MSATITATAVDCPGCHHLNPAGTIFCTTCRRKLVIGHGLKRAEAAPAPAPAKRGFWQKLTSRTA